MSAGPRNAGRPQPRTLIVVLNWNGPQLTAECVRSLEAMRGAEFSILVVDNGSEDGSVEYLRRQCPGVEIIANEVNLGFTGGCNTGLRVALERNYDFALLINNDTIVEESFLGALLDEATRRDNAAILSPKILYYDMPDRVWWVGGSYSKWTGLARHHALGQKDRGWTEVRNLSWATGCALLLRCSALRSVGLFDDAIFANSEDVDLSLRVVGAGYSIVFVPAARLWHKEGVTYRKNVGDSGRMFMQVRNTLWVWRKHARWWHACTCWPYLLLFYIPKMCVLAALRHQSNPLLTMLRGIRAYWRMRNDPYDRSTFPRGFRCTPRLPGNTAQEIR